MRQPISRGASIARGAVVAALVAACDAEMFTIIPDDGQITRPAIQDAGGGAGRPVPGQSGYSGATSLPTPRSAEFTRYAPCEMRIGSNGGIGFLDIGLGRCYACPEGYTRTIFHVESAQACEWTPQATVYSESGWGYAADLGLPGCAPGEFQMSDACFVCPSGYYRGSGRECVPG